LGTVTEPTPDFYDEVERRGAHYRDSALEFNKLAVAYSQKGFETLTYLNGGALVALPAALAFFKTDVARISIILVAAAFILGLLLVVLAQLMAFFTMAKRSESQELRYHEQVHRVAAQSDPERNRDAQRSFEDSEGR
jgi:hypothetical protein